MAITFSSSDLKFTPKNKKGVSTWITQVIIHHKLRPGDIHFTFCSDQKLLEINLEFLKHNTYTDIITFDYSEEDKIAGEIFISIDRIKENAEKFTTSFYHELHRVMIHGILHLCGYTDKTPKDKKKMTSAEDECLALREF